MFGRRPHTPSQPAGCPIRRRAHAVALTLLFVALVLGGSDLAVRASGPQASEPQPHPILSDVRVRRAIAYCTNKDALMASVHPDLTPAERQAFFMDTFIPPDNWAYTRPSVIYDYDPAAGQALLEQAGWLLSPGDEYRRKEPLGQLTLTLTTTDAAYRKTFLTVFEAQMKGCGIRLIRNHMPAAWWFGESTGLAVRDFELSDFAWVSEEDPKGETLYSCDMIPLPANGWYGQNYMGWCNPTASSALKMAVDTSLSQTQRKAHYATVIEEMAKDVPTLPLFIRPGSISPNYTWEHIDFNLQTFSETSKVTPAAVGTWWVDDFDGNQAQMSHAEGVVSETTLFKYTPLVEGFAVPAGPASLRAMRLTASVDGVPKPPNLLLKPLTFRFLYTDEQVVARHLREDSLRLYALKDGQWQDASLTCAPELRRNEAETVANMVVATACELGEFTVRGTGKYDLYLPMLQR